MIMISVIIPCLNEKDFIGRLLDDLAGQHFQDFEVIVSDSGSSDNTLHVAGKYSDKLLINTVVAKEKGVSLARNNGAGKAKGEWLLFLDADVSLPPNFLESSLKEIKSKKLTVASNKFKPDSNSLLDRLGSSFVYGYMLLFSRSKWPMAGGSCIWIKRHLHDAINGFDDRLAQAEDLEYLQRAVKNGGYFRYIKSVSLTVSLRRFRQHGRLKMIYRYVKVEIYRFTHKNRVEKNIIDYEFGESNK